MSVPDDGHKTRARATITVAKSEREPLDRGPGPALTEIRIHETFSGDLVGESTVTALEVQRGEHSAQLVSLQRFRGRLAGRQGAFVLQGAEVVEDGQIRATWSVVPGSGDGELRGLRGEGGFEGRFGSGSQGTLDYWFE